MKKFISILLFLLLFSCDLNKKPVDQIDLEKFKEVENKIDDQSISIDNIKISLNDFEKDIKDLESKLEIKKVAKKKIIKVKPKKKVSKEKVYQYRIKYHTKKKEFYEIELDKLLNKNATDSTESKIENVIITDSTKEIIIDATN